jgi:hypothetical protein
VIFNSDLETGYVGGGNSESTYYKYLVYCHLDTTEDGQVVVGKIDNVVEQTVGASSERIHGPNSVNRSMDLVGENHHLRDHILSLAGVGEGKPLNVKGFFGMNQETSEYKNTNIPMYDTEYWDREMYAARDYQDEYGNKVTQTGEVLEKAA